jgi:SSS family solute:Na+ symporter
MTVKSNRELNRSVLIGGVFILVMTGVAFVVGTLSNEFFFKNHNGLSAIGFAGGNTDRIIPFYLKNAMPSWFNYLFLLTLLSAAMSTLSSQFHTMGTAISRDIAEATGLVKDKDEVIGKKSILTAKLGVGVMIILTLIISFVLPGGVIAAATAIFFGLCAASFLPTLIGSLYWKKATKAGAITSIVSGFFVTIFWLFFVHAATLKKLGLKSILSGSSWANVDPLFIGFPVSLIIFVAVSLFTKPMDDEHLNKCFK